ncbi:hypothetical protein HPB50_011430 [Hyalomma asiaticum]|uniref:Uncharacterized protein n=1 Tax=Hyalomma asiaticum TaxID=266040 RepID=A0ACB7TIW3_HYAAI|nr:hypothetical protein HPB50_011430 [Hyalomma asiaticum]
MIYIGDITVALIPLNMHPERHEGSRASLAKALHSAYGNYCETFCTDAADYPDRRARVAAVADWNGEVL